MKKHFLQAIVILSLTILTGASVARAIVRYAPAASISAGDITSTMILDNTILGNDISKTASTTMFRLQVSDLQATSTTATSTFAGGLSVAGTTGLTVLQNGKVGIGTNAPNYQVHIVGDSPNVVLNRYSDDASPAVVRMVKSRGTESSPSAVLLNDLLGALYFGGQYDATNQQSNTAGIVAYAAENFSSGHQGTYLSFQTRLKSSSTFTEKMRLDDAGNLGIASTSPNNKLDINGNFYASGSGFFGGAITATSTLTLSNIGLNMLLTSNGSGTLVASSTPTAASYLATSTTATSTFAGGLKLNLAGSGIEFKDGTVQTSAAASKVAVQSSGVSVNSNTATTTVFTIAIPAGTLNTNNAVRVRVFTTYFNFYNGAGSANMYLAVAYGATTAIASSQTVTTGVNGGFSGYFDIDVISNGATNAQKVTLATIPITSYTTGPMMLSGTAAVDSTAAQNLVFTVRFDTNSIYNGITTLWATATKIGN